MWKFVGFHSDFLGTRSVSNLRSCSNNDDLAPVRKLGLGERIYLISGFQGVQCLGWALESFISLNFSCTIGLTVLSVGVVVGNFAHCRRSAR